MSNYKVFVLSFLISCATIFCYAQESEKILLIFGAKWCKYCTTAKNDIKTNSELSEAIKQYTVIDVDYDKDQDIVKGHKIKVLPTFIIFQNGKEINRQTGYNSPDKLLTFLK
jgi:thioredoxin 1